MITFLLAWIALSLPVGLLVGKALRRTQFVCTRVEDER